MVSSLSEPIPCCESCQAARLPRIDLPGIQQHIVQRGNNRLPCFLDDGDRLRYLHLLHEALQATGCKLHAYVLMDNHVHLLITPPAAGRIGQLMQRLGRLTDDPASYRWSSCPASLGQRGHSALTPHPCWLAPVNDPLERSNAYRARSMKPCPTNCSPASAVTYSSSELRATMPSARWSKPRSAALRASGPLIGRASRAPSTDK